MSTTTMATGRERYWVPGDWNAFFGFGTNILVNVLVLTGLLRYVLKMPDSLVFGRILPALGLMLFLSTCYYAWLAYRLAQKTGRTDVCALPSGTSVPHMFVVTFVVMLPILLRTNDPIQAWEAGLTWVFVQSFVLMAGGFIAPVIRRITPRAALLGSLAGISITFISMRPGLLVFETPLIGMVCFAIILANWFGGVRYFRDVPGGLIAIAAGTLIAWGSDLFGLGYGGLSVGSVGDAFSHFGFSFPVPAVGHVFSGFKFIGVILVTAIPFGIYDLVEAMDNVESAAAAGDSFPTTQVLTADGVISLIGCLLGNPFINAVYIGHPGWKAMGGRIGYSAATGVMVLVLTWLGIVALVSSLIPVVAILPILLYIGMLIGSQAFQEIAAEPCAGDHPGDDSADRRLGQNHDRRRARRRRHQRRHGRFRQARQYRHIVQGPGDARRRRDARRHHPRRGHRVHHRTSARKGRGLRARRLDPDVFRPDPRRGSRHRPVACGGAELSRHRRDAL